MPWIIHGFRGNGELASQLVRLGFYLSFGDRFNPSALRAAWLDSLFLETDDKSIDIRGVYQNVAEALDIPEEKLEEWKKEYRRIVNFRFSIKKSYLCLV